jgi:hypothetical protein
MSVKNLQRQKKDSLSDFTAGRSDAPPAPKSCRNTTECFFKNAENLNTQLQSTPFAFSMVWKNGKSHQTLHFFSA